MDLLNVVIDCMKTFFTERTFNVFIFSFTAGLVIGYLRGKLQLSTMLRETDLKHSTELRESDLRHSAELREADLRHADELREAEGRHHNEMEDLKRRAGERIARLKQELAAARDPSGKVALVGFKQPGEWDEEEENTDEW